MREPEEIERDRARRRAELKRRCSDTLLADAVRRGLVTPAAVPPGPPPETAPVTRLAELLQDLEEDRADR